MSVSLHLYICVFVGGGGERKTDSTTDTELCGVVNN